MKKSLKIIYIILALIIGCLIIFLLLKKPKEFNKTTFPINNVVSDRTETDFLTTIIHTGLHVLEIDSSYIIIAKMPESMRNGLGDEYNMKAFIIGNNKQYMIYVSDLNRYEAITVLSHELIHLQQYRSGRLKLLGNKKILWEGIEFIPSNLPYDQRPWEIEAHAMDDKIEKQIINILLN